MSTEQQNIESITNTDVATEATNTATNTTSTSTSTSTDNTSASTSTTTAPTTSSTESTSSNGQTTTAAANTTTSTTVSTNSPPNNKRKEVDTTQPPKYIETRIRKKAREALDLISNTKQRQASLFNLLGNDYTGPTEQQLEMIFRLFSRNGKTIGADELKSVIRAMGKRPLTRRIDKILNECDENGNGTIEMDEFVRYMQKKAMEKAKTLGLLGESDDDEEENEGGDTDEEKEDGTPKKRAANAKPKSKKSTKKATTTAAATTTTAAATTATATTTTATTAPPKSVMKQPSFFQPIKKGSSIVHYYTENAGTHINTNVELDQYSNPKGVEHDLGVEGAFTQFTILIGRFYSASDLECIKDLKSKGFQIVEALTQKDFINKLPQSDIALIISGYVNDNSTTEQEFADKVEEYHKVGKGLFIWNDNAPYILQGNWVTKRLYGVVADGNEPGKQDLTLGNGLDKQHFSSHLVTSGIVNLYEGVTISSFADITPANGKLEVLASSSQGNKIMLVSSTDPTKVDANCGRVVIDSGFTKLFAQFFSAGTGRYVKNCCVWLLALDHRFRLGVEVSGEIEKPKEVPVWQYLHGTWNDYDNDASKVVEEAYQEWLTNPYTDVRSVKSGAWAYQIDFKQNKQTNIQHFAHKIRDIRRVLKNVVKPTIN
ncbi:hypothetical protein DDB_G0291810 [Dictyostelium discoideum AX4]|uniref:Calmodulin n=1 Tax=Dictyostelium discoideum TaxID=44689 RepID=Q54E45_DICDI|nr:hypothetical protein DDB_G0291810 [Dictyostelium discoideum AX4]EAL61526.1 hypothetical protein DDB_G0291810 [Dictyostelium discoideum AX4]|eukprot:XP_629942.1 hypothetical protein DDB_G0291810 [Dictyostelium discoideum AX4]